MPLKGDNLKSQVNKAILLVLIGICEDIRAAYPEYSGIEADIATITRCSQSRGLGFFTLDLPHLDSLLLFGLETGRLKLEGPLSTRVSSKIQVPRVFSGLWLRIFDRNSCLRQDLDVNAILFLRQLCCLAKKMQLECSPNRLQSARENYHAVEESCRPPTLKWDDDKLDAEGANRLSLSDCAPHLSSLDLFSLVGDYEESKKVAEDQLILEHVQKVADMFMQITPSFCPWSLTAERIDEGKLSGLKHGPGAVAERMDAVSKYSFPFWPYKLEATFPFAFFGNVLGMPREGGPLRHEGPSRLLFVRKTAKSPRVIASEPVAHQWCQQLVKSWMSSVTEKTQFGLFINFRRQDLSGDMVLQASSNRRLATVDLSDASDRLSCWTVERMFRGNPSLLKALHAARTRYIRDSQSGYPDSFIKLKKFASQGTATTFPVQSWVFCICAIASTLAFDEVTWERIEKLRDQVRIFGDDIILPRYGYVRLVRILNLLGLKVNDQKSFVNGHFRESCGVDGYKGYDVTPCKPMTLVVGGPESVQALIDTTNNLYSKGYWHASARAESLIPGRIRRLLPVIRVTDSGSTGLFSFVGSDYHCLERRWNRKLHRWEVRRWSLRDQQRMALRNGGEALLAFLASGGSPGQDPRITSEVRLRKRSIGRLRWEPLSGCANWVASLGYHLHRKRPRVYRDLRRTDSRKRLRRDVGLLDPKECT